MRKPSPGRRFRPLALEPIEPRRLLAFAAELVADVDDTTRSPATYPSSISEFNGSIVYSGRGSGSGDELWQSDGTKAGTHLIKDIFPGEESSRPRYLTNVAGNLFFTAKTPSTGTELWRSDGTAAGTYLVKDIYPGKEESLPISLVNMNGKLFFNANDGLHGSELWISDGTAAGTRMVKDILPGKQGGFPGQLTNSQGRLFFAAYQGDFNHISLWVSDGTAAGTRSIALPDGTSVSGIACDINGTVYFHAKNAETGRELWRTDGTDEGTQLVVDLRPGTADSIETNAYAQFANINGTLFFRANDGIHGIDLWKTDGTPEGTQLVKDLGDPVSGYGPDTMLNANGTLYFAHDRQELWKSDGTPADTVRVFDFGGDHGFSRLTPIGDTLYFAANGGDGYEFWKSDGTTGGTLQVKDIHPGGYDDYYYGYQQFSSYPGNFHKLGDTIVFSAADVNGGHLWTTDGTTAGTRLMDDLDYVTPSSRAQQLYNFNGRLLFSAEEEYSGDIGTAFSTWISDGTPGGTVELAETLGKDFADIDGTVYFSGNVKLNDFYAGRELWRTDGTKEGTVFVKDINTGIAYSGLSSDPNGFIAIGGKVVFAASSEFNGRELWMTDGTPDDTREVKDINPAGGSFPAQFVRLGEYVYFTAHDPTHDTELWRTDGTAEGTQLVKDIDGLGRQPGQTMSLGPEGLVVFRDKLYFTADDGVHGRDLWRSDGTAAGTVMVRDLIVGSATARTANVTVVGDRLFFTTYASGKMSLWTSDGTSAGTRFVAFIPPSQEFTDVDGTLYFVGTGAEVTELWQSDGTAAGTHLVKDLSPGPAGSDPRNLQEINGVLFFEADLPYGGRGHWISNGTPSGTHPLNAAGSGLTAQSELTNVNGALYFAGTDGVHGQELWRFKTASPALQFSGALNYRENDPLKLIAPFATISDADNVRFTGGTLTVAVDQNAGQPDRIEIRNQGNDAGQISVSGRAIRYGDVVIGSYRDGLPGSHLVIDLNSQATVAATQALLRNIGYRNDSDNPSTLQRTVTVTLTDGSGGISQPVSKAINVEAVNDPPRLVLGGQTSYKNNSPPILLAPAATVTDPDSTDFLGGVLTVAITSGGSSSNRLWVSGAYSLNGDRLLRNGVVVGTVLDSGFGWNPLRLQFNAQMTAARVQELVRSLRFRTFDNINLNPRIISFTLTDGDGGVSATQTKTVNITA
jgi:ELWxxDGT repeat protein